MTQSTQTPATSDKVVTISGFSANESTSTSVKTEGGATTKPTAAEEAAAKEAAKAKLKAALAAKAVGYYWHTNPDASYTEKDVNIVTAKNGVFRVTETPIGIFASRLAETKEKANIPGLVDMKEGVTLKIPKIGFHHWLRVLSWYKDVVAKDGSEASVLFFWNHNEIEIPRKWDTGRDLKGISEEGQLVIYVPEQKNSGSLSDFTADTMVKWLRENCALLLETHSHNTMGAFWSGTDDANENMTQFYGVYGKVTSAAPEFLFRYVHGDQKINVSHWELFEKPMVRTISHVQFGGYTIEVPTKAEFAGPWPKLEYPDDWMGQHSKSWGSAYQGGQHYYGAYGGEGYQRTNATTHATSASSNRAGSIIHDDEAWSETWYGHRGAYRHKTGGQVLDLTTGQKKTRWTRQQTRV